MVGEQRLVHKTAPAGPGAVFTGLRQHRHELEVRVFLLPAGQRVQQVQVVLVADAPVQRHRPAHALAEGVLEDALDRREAGGTGHEEDGPLAVVQREAAQRAFEVDGVADLHLLDGGWPGSAGALANEKARRAPSSSTMLMYCPATKGSF